MSNPLQQVISNNQQIQSSINSNNFGEQTRQLIQQNKIATLSFDYLNQTEIKNINSEELKAARLFNELNVLYSIGVKNYEEFERAITKLRVFYENFGQLQPSQDQNQFIALYLLYLLSFNKMGQFHTYLELLPISDLQNKYIKFVLDLERSISVGNYKDVLNSKQNSTLPQFSLFLERIIHTVRYEIARSAEKSYKKLQVQDVVQIFNLSGPQEVEQFVLSQVEPARDNGFIWVQDKDVIYFNPITQENTKIDFKAIISKSLHYADELEKII
ncbi:hypothetical protein PPERSA_00078 [Pseudocohnilembus persalinus]|uniref:PCI domain-containing protein n=1 Tax=Pseudocohnilembus persalinus TaxID=266149 RepID=A0A0V0QYR6_PSEPJ|nr:hypothetical protein PPERSA_00078 [Pseudocohnilembus persalinus]|eukprot:KRX07168.1 hypothetical protein PPERSA_00078 [Pseudocohnilembus persalinus]